MMRFCCNLSLILIFLTLSVFSLKAPLYGNEIPEKIVLSAIQNEQTHFIATEILKKAYQKIGCDIRFSFLPGTRAIEYANQGLTDGDVARIYDTGEKYPDLIRVDVPIIRFTAVAFTKSVKRKIDSWEQLKGLRVGIIRGIRYSFIGTDGLKPFYAKDMTHLFRLLDQGNIEVAIAGLDAGEIEIERKYKKSGIRVAGSSLYSGELYHFVHKKNRKLVGTLKRTLDEMDESGEIKKIYNDTRRKFYEPAARIKWPYLCFPPLYLCGDKGLEGGTGYQILQLIWHQMPEYKHETELMPLKRILESARAGEKQLFYGLYKTPEREEFLHFSLPCRLSTPTYIIIRKSDRADFGTADHVSLKYLLGKTDRKFLLLNAVSFGAGIDELLKTHRESRNVLIEYNTTNMGEKSLKLLIDKRVDYVLSLDSTSYDARALGISEKISWLKIDEQSKYEVGYITAPKTEWGAEAIRKVDMILRREIPTKAFFNIFKPLVNDEMASALRREFEEKILGPAQKTTGMKR